MSMVVIGGGAFGTAIAAAAALAGRPTTLLVREAAAAAALNDTGRNDRYFPGHRLPADLTATTDGAVLADAEVIAIAIPSHAIEVHLAPLARHVRPGAAVANLAKGLHRTTFTLDRLIASLLPQAAVGSLKGPTFARPLLHGAPSAMTLAFADAEAGDRVAAALAGSTIRLDRWADVPSVEFASAIKNIYSISMGICDAVEENPNTRFAILTRIIREAHELVAAVGFDPAVLFTFAGLGDLLMTALNDNSRNRTLGLLIGRGFSLSNRPEGPIIEGANTIRLLLERLGPEAERFPILTGLDAVFRGDLGSPQFFHLMTGGLP